MNPNQNQMQSQNPLLQNNGMIQKLKSIKQMANMFQNSGNNQDAMMQMLAQQNPEVANIIQQANSSGMTLKQLFMQQAGANGNSIIDMLK